MSQTYLTCDRASSVGGHWRQLSLPLTPWCLAPELSRRAVCLAVRASTERPPHARGLLGASWADDAVGVAYVLRARWASATGRGRACRSVRRRSCARGGRLACEVSR